MNPLLSKRLASGALAACLLTPSALLFGCGGPAGKYVPGTYTGEGRGMGGPIEVTLTVDDNDIVSVDEIEGEGETQGVGGKEAIEDGTFAMQIMEAQSDEIDGITGATATTGGVEAAVRDALEQAENE